MYLEGLCVGRYVGIIGLYAFGKFKNNLVYN
jgi:hypothetical protein